MIEPRRFTCTSCGQEIDVFELPVPFVDAERFRCIPCMDSRHEAVQLELVGSSARPARREERRYDPAQAAVPY